MNRKQGEIAKSFPSVSVETNGNEQYMADINQFTRKELNSDEVYVFPVTLCNNDIDRDYEQFTLDSLVSLSKLYVGKTGISDHNPTSSNQCCRIFKTSVDPVPGKKNKLGEDFYNLNALAYIMRTPQNEPLIADIDAGIKKEVSVGCSVARNVCSICGKDYYSDVECSHRKKQSYDGKTCFVKLENPVDAYEFSFVAIPAQPEAGIQKAYEKTKKEKKEGKAVFEYKEILKEYGIEKAQFEDLNIPVETVENIVELVKSKLGSISATKTFITKEQVKEIIGEEKTSQEVLDMLKSTEDMKSKAGKYDSICSMAINQALAEGVKAKGDKFNHTKWEKILKNLEYNEILDQREEWHNEAETALNAGTRKSEPYSGRNESTRDFDERRYNF